MFGKRESLNRYDKDAIEALQILDVVIREIHPERFCDDFDAAIYVNPTRIAINTFLGRPDTERFFPIEYEALVMRFGFYVDKGLAQDLVNVSPSMPPMRALMLGLWHEYKLRHVLKKPHDKYNLGREVQNSMKTFVQFLNQGATTKPEPMPAS